MSGNSYRFPGWRRPLGSTAAKPRSDAAKDFKMRNIVK
jgi:hypothetical protein